MLSSTPSVRVKAAVDGAGPEGGDRDVHSRASSNWENAGTLKTPGESHLERPLLHRQRN